MAKMKKYLVLSFSIIFFTFSCQKDFLIDSDPSSNNLDTITLKKFILLDTTLSSPNDTITIVKFLYDNLRRCTKIIADDRNGNINYTDLSYNNTDTLISILKTYASSSIDFTNEYFTYSSTGQMINDSLIEYSGTSITNTFNYDFSLLNSTNISFTRKNGQQYSKTKHFIQTDVNGNITLQRDTSFLYNAGNNTYNINLTNFQTINYDNRNCPFYKFSPTFPVGFIMEGGNIAGSNSIYVGLSRHRNNITQEIITILTSTGGFANYDDIYQYTYNSLDYPNSVRIRDNTQSKIFKGLYFY